MLTDDSWHKDIISYWAPHIKIACDYFVIFQYYIYYAAKEHLKGVSTSKISCIIPYKCVFDLLFAFAIKFEAIRIERPSHVSNRRTAVYSNVLLFHYNYSMPHPISSQREQHKLWVFRLICAWRRIPVRHLLTSLKKQMNPLSKKIHKWVDFYAKQQLSALEVNTWNHCMHAQ